MQLPLARITAWSIWRDFGPFLLAYPFKILHILGLVLINWPLQLSPQVFDWIGWSLRNVDFVVMEPFLCGSWGMLWVIGWFESPPMVKSQPSGRGNQIFSQNWRIGINYAINPNQCPWTSGIKTAPKHDWPTTIFHRGYEVLLFVCISVPTPNMPMLYLTKMFNFGLITHCIYTEESDIRGRAGGGEEGLNNQGEGEHIRMIIQ